MVQTGIYPDFIVVDGNEGGTGAAPLEFMDHLGMPMREGVNFVHNALIGINARDRIRIGASGKIATAFDVARAMALGADWCNSARGFMFALGCIQSLACHTSACPTGVSTQDPVRQRALVVGDKMERVYRFHENTLEALKELVQAAGLEHPNQIRATHIVRRGHERGVRLLANSLPFVQAGELLAAMRGEGRWPHAVYELYWPQARAESFAAAA
jgi:glutamate synthase domain-containing protein 2